MEFAETGRQLHDGRGGQNGEGAQRTSWCPSTDGEGGKWRSCTCVAAVEHAISPESTMTIRTADSR